MIQNSLNFCLLWVGVDVLVVMNDWIFEFVVVVEEHGSVAVAREEEKRQAEGFEVAEGCKWASLVSRVQAFATAVLLE